MSEEKYLNSGIVLKLCQRCGQSFGCGAAFYSCECFSINLSSEVLNQIKNNYDDCLCISCLKELESFKKVNC
ncbi:cysteine-rich CWC family protein [Leptospira noguchii]|uniref:cysteine-rich CWC family protein n=1 Tax=Leptospira noguchii TaxID=28182 RepID=UPI0002BF7F29|nr:cysteine-rich CWC family protein [Leptospira noguchii]EMI72199.1 cysteine-rich CWC [Leptospira noguchii str. Bonito]EMS89529.1 cysteine-rich CWC [Leptospira noguchii str. Cascata]UOG38075.1 cysteine-rich CWC family protein [Leptospira noguchii]